MSMSNSEAVANFIRGGTGGSRHLFSTKSTDGKQHRLYSYGSHFVVAVKSHGYYILNGDTYSVTTSHHQSIVRGMVGRSNRHFTIPFSALREAGIFDYEDIEILDNIADSNVKVPYKDPDTGEELFRWEHTLGATLFKYRKKYYLSGIEAETKGRGQGYFLVLLPHPCTTMTLAYESLKPKAMTPETPFIRQGEFFFVDLKENTRGLKQVLKSFGKKIPQPKKAFDITEVFPRKQRGQIVRGNPHVVTEAIRLDKKTLLVRGVVKHREHKNVRLGKTWHRVYINQAKESYNAKGNVD